MRDEDDDRPIEAQHPAVVGLDLSLAATGWATWHPITGAISFGTVKSRAIGTKRLAEILQAVGVQINYLPAALSPLVMLEGFAFGRPQQAHQLGELHGVVKYWLYQRLARVVSVPPPRLKKYLTGRGNAQKGVMIREVWKRYDLDAGDDNQADAIALLMMGLCLIGAREPQNAAQRDILSRVQAF